MAVFTVLGIQVDSPDEDEFLVRVCDSDSDGSEIETFKVDSWKSAKRAQAALLEVSSQLSPHELQRHHRNRRWHTVLGVPVENLMTLRTHR